MTQEEFWNLSVAHYEAVETFLQSVDTRLEMLCNLCMAGLVVALGVCFYYLFWRRR